MDYLFFEGYDLQEEFPMKGYWMRPASWRQERTMWLFLL